MDPPPVIVVVLVGVTADAFAQLPPDVLAGVLNGLPADLVKELPEPLLRDLPQLVLDGLTPRLHALLPPPPPATVSHSTARPQEASWGNKPNKYPFRYSRPPRKQNPPGTSAASSIVKYKYPAVKLPPFGEPFAYLPVPPTGRDQVDQLFTELIPVLNHVSALRFRLYKRGRSLHNLLKMEDTKAMWDRVDQQIVHIRALIAALKDHGFDAVVPSCVFAHF